MTTFITNYLPTSFKRWSLSHYKLILSTLVLALVTACGGGNSSNNVASTPETNDLVSAATTTTTTTKTGRLYVDMRASGISLLPVGNLNYTLTTGTTVTTGVTTSTGYFTYTDGSTIAFTIAGKTFGPIAAQATITHKQLATAACTGSTIPNCVANIEANFKNLVASLDTDLQWSNGYNLSTQQSTLPNLDFTQSVASFSDTLQATGITLIPNFTPFLGINTEEPQPESQTIGGQAVAFADVFRIASPFKEYSCPHITYDANGWPTTIPATCASQPNTFLQSATTAMLRNAPTGAIPEGQYIVLYQGSGTMVYSGTARGTKALLQS